MSTAPPGQTDTGSLLNWRRNPQLRGGFRSAGSIPADSIPDGLHDAEHSPAGGVFLDTHVVEAGRPALRCERLRLLVGPPVAGEPGGARTHAAFDRQQPPPGDEYSAC